MFGNNPIETIGMIAILPSIYIKSDANGHAKGWSLSTSK